MDPRTALGYQVEERVTGPFEVMAAERVGDGSDGGTLDRALVARLEDGRSVVIGEVWAAGVGPAGVKVRLDAAKVAAELVDVLNHYGTLANALRDIRDLRDHCAEHGSLEGWQGSRPGEQQEFDDWAADLADAALAAAGREGPPMRGRSSTHAPLGRPRAY